MKLKTLLEIWQCFLSVWTEKTLGNFQESMIDYLNLNPS